MANPPRQIHLTAKDSDNSLHRSKLVSPHSYLSMDQLLLSVEARNESIHGHDLSSQHKACHRRLCAKMEELHSKRDQVLASDANMFSLANHNKLPLRHFLQCLPRPIFRIGSTCGTRQSCPASKLPVKSPSKVSGILLPTLHLQTVHCKARTQPLAIQTHELTAQPVRA
jgi:hypothetical protein